MTYAEMEAGFYRPTEKELASLMQRAQLERYQALRQKQALTKEENKFCTEFETGAGYQALPLNTQGYPALSALFQEQEGAFHIAQHPRYCAEPAHRHDFFEIFIAYAGHCSIVIDGDAMELKQGDVCILGLHTWHQVQPLEVGDIVLCMRIKSTMFYASMMPNPLTLEFFRPQAENRLVYPALLLHCAAREKLWNNLRQLFCEYNEHDALSFACAQLSIILFFHELARCWAEVGMELPAAPPTQNLAEQLLEYISHFSDTCTLESLSKQFGYSPTYLSHYIHEKLGSSFSVLRKQFRMESATRRLLNTTDSIAEIAASVGYSSLDAFYRAFQERYGMTPSQYRKLSQTR